MAKIRAMMGGGGSQPTETTLWTNTSPSADFTATTVTLSESIQNFDYIKVMYKFNKSDSDSTAVGDMMTVADFVYCSTSSAVKQKLFLGAKLDNYSNARSVIYNTNTKIDIGNSTRVNQSGQNNAYTIPIKIVGIKY